MGKKSAKRYIILMPPEESRKALIFLFKSSIYKDLRNLNFSILGNKNVQK